MNKLHHDLASLNHLRRMAVRLRQQGKSLREVKQVTGLSAPTVIAASKAFTQHGWDAVDVKGRGGGQGRLLDVRASEEVKRLIASVAPEHAGVARPLWSQDALLSMLQEKLQRQLTVRTVERYLARWGLQPPNPYQAAALEQPHWLREHYPLLLRRLQAEGGEVFWGGVWNLADGNARQLMCARSKHGTVYWLPMLAESPGASWSDFAARLQQSVNKKVLLLMPAGWTLPANSQRIEWLSMPGAFAPRAPASGLRPRSAERPVLAARAGALCALDLLEGQTLHQLREIAATAVRPLMRYTASKEMSVLLHLAQKAFWPGPSPFGLLPPDPGQSTRELSRFCDQQARRHGVRLLAPARSALETVLYATRDGAGEGDAAGARVFPLDEWSSLDLWRYIQRETIPLAPAYFAAQHPVFERDGQWLLADDERTPATPGATVSPAWVRLPAPERYPRVGAVPSRASTLEALIAEGLRPAPVCRVTVCANPTSPSLGEAQ
jgi:3'-phosphoadenosine 5'-phosphosulfate sulfotransferase (PAPS reductase)/FAD synthetase/transposase